MKRKVTELSQIFLLPKSVTKKRKFYKDDWGYEKFTEKYLKGENLEFFDELYKKWPASFNKWMTRANYIETEYGLCTYDGKLFDFKTYLIMMFNISK